MEDGAVVLRRYEESRQQLESFLRKQRFNLIRRIREKFAI
jgi:hypothetical protein